MIDPRAILIFLAANILAIALAAFLAARNYPEPARRALIIFAGGKVVLGAGFLLAVLRGALPDLIGVVAVNSILAGGFLTNLAAVRELQDKRSNLTFMTSVPICVAALTAYFLYVHQDMQAVRIVFSAAGLLAYTLVAKELFFNYRHSGWAHLFAGTTIAAVAVAFAVRLLVAVAQPVAMPARFELGFLAMGFMATTLGAMCFALMLNDALAAELRTLVATDPLSGLANRRHVIERGEQEMVRARRFAHPLSALVIDMDQFKRLNDTWGHAMGDQAIRAVAAACLGAVRDVDLVGRIGGDELTVVLPEANLATASEVGERLRHAIQAIRLNARDNVKVSLSATVGVAVLADERTFYELLDRADQAMYTAKKRGGNQTSASAAVA